MKLELKPGEKITVEFELTDGAIRVEFNEDRIVVKADMLDDIGRVGVIYEELFEPGRLEK